MHAPTLTLIELIALALFALILVVPAGFVLVAHLNARRAGARPASRPTSARACA